MGQPENGDARFIELPLCRGVQMMVEFVASAARAGGRKGLKSTAEIFQRKKFCPQTAASAVT